MAINKLTAKELEKLNGQKLEFLTAIAWRGMLHTSCLWQYGDAIDSLKEQGLVIGGSIMNQYTGYALTEKGKKTYRGMLKSIGSK